MEIREGRKSGFVVLEPVGRIDTKTSHEFEKKIVELLNSGERRFLIDLAEVEYMSSAGLRVLLMLAKKLSGTDGHLALCSMNDQVREVFEIAGFTSIFTIAPSQAEAIQNAPQKAKSSKVVELAAKLLGLSRRGSPSGLSQGGASSGTTAEAARLLGVKARPPASSGEPARPAPPSGTEAGGKGRAEEGQSSKPPR